MHFVKICLQESKKDEAVRIVEVGDGCPQWQGTQAQNRLKDESYGHILHSHEDQHVHQPSIVNA